LSERSSKIISRLGKRAHFELVASKLVERHMVFRRGTGKSLENDDVGGVFMPLFFVDFEISGRMGQDRRSVDRFGIRKRFFQEFSKRFFVRDREAEADGIAQKENAVRSLRFFVRELTVAPYSLGIRSDGNDVLPNVHSPKNNVLRNDGKIGIVVRNVEEESFSGIRKNMKIRLSGKNPKSPLHEKESEKKGSDDGKRANEGLADFDIPKTACK
jgi:hypothetical protein